MSMFSLVSTGVEVEIGGCGGCTGCIGCDGCIGCSGARPLRSDGDIVPGDLVL